MGALPMPKTKNINTGNYYFNDIHHTLSSHQETLSIFIFKNLLQCVSFKFSISNGFCVPFGKIIQIQNLSAVKSGKPRIKNLFLDLTLPVILNQFAIHLKFVW